MTLRHTPLVAMAVVGLALGGCGASAKPSPTPQRALPQTPVVDLTADPSGDYDFQPSAPSASAGKLTIELYNPLSTFGAHGIAIEGHGVHATAPAVARGGVARLTVTLTPGRYRVYSPVREDIENGMTTTLTIHGAATERAPSSNVPSGT